MPWFKVDDGFAFHRKTLSATNQAIGLWVKAGSWCAQQLTDGHIPVSVIVAFGSSLEDAQCLVDADLWEVDGEGFRFLNWAEFQPSKAEVEKEREKARKRKQQWRDRQNGESPDGSPAGTTSGTDSGTNGESPDGKDGGGAGSPTRPDPTHISTGAKRATQMPKDWQPKDEHLAIAREYGLDPAFELRGFKDRNEAKGTLYKNWDAAFRTWLNQAKTFRGNSHPPYSASAASPVSRKHVPIEVPAHIDPDDGPAYAAWLREVASGD